MLTQFQNYANTSICDLNQAYSSEGISNPNLGYQLGAKLGNLLGTCDKYGQITESSYSLDRYVDYVYQQKSVFSNIFTRASEKVTNFFKKLTNSVFFDIDKERDSNVMNLEIDLLTEIMKQVALHDLSDFRQDILNIISSSLKRAEAKNKPLLILLGETHGRMSTSLLESFILYLSSQLPNLSLSNVFTEAFDANFYEQPEYSVDPCNVVEKVIEHLGLTKIQMDLAACQIFKPDIPKVCEVIDYEKLMSGVIIDSVEKAKLKEGLKKRNQIMTEVMIAFKNDGNAIAIIGKAHLYGIMQETKLQDYYHVVPILVGPNLDFDRTITKKQICEKEYYKMCKNYYLKDPSVTNFYSLPYFDFVMPICKSQDIMQVACEASHSNKDSEKIKTLCKF